MNRLNLLPPDRKIAIEFSKRNARLYQLLMKLIAGFFLLIVIMAVIGYLTYLSKENATEEKRLSENLLAGWGKTETDARDFAARLALIETIKDGSIKWDKVFSEISNSTPENVVLISYDFTNNAKQRITFSGFALSSTDIGQFRELLSESDIFEYVDIEKITTGRDPVSQTSGLTFTMTMSLKLSEVRK